MTTDRIDGALAPIARPRVRATLLLLATSSALALSAPALADSVVFYEAGSTAGQAAENQTYTNDDDIEATLNGAVTLVGTGAKGSNTVTQSGSGRYKAGVGGYGGQISVTNHGDLTVDRDADPNANALGLEGGGWPGLFDRQGLLTGINVAGVGGAGGDANGSGGSSGDGGLGGQGGVVEIVNDGAITIERAFPYGGIGILATSAGGDGGHENGGAGDGGQDDMGGGGGVTNTVTVTNAGTITLNGSGPNTINGIRVENFAGAGGAEAGAGAVTAKTTVTHTGAISVTGTNTGSNEMVNGIAGISVFNRSGAGAQSDDNSDAGGLGGAPGAIEVDSTGRIDVTATGLQPYSNDANRSGGIVAYSAGGRGGNSPSPDGSDGSPGGVGGGSDAQVSVKAHGEAITVVGDRAVGIGAFARGGDGGNGRAQADAGDGGFGGDAHVQTWNGQQITTDGLKAVGIQAKSEGGVGGGQDEDGDGIIDSYNPTAGDGGDGGTVTILAGDDPDADGIAHDDGLISTQGSQAHGLHGLSFGAAGGGATGSFVIVGSTVGNGGGGGAGGSVLIINGSRIATAGSFAVGILGQSIGGGGGDVDPGDVAEGDLIAVAGSGGEGGSANTVTVQSNGTIDTTGEAALGILAQSIGGGGGNGGSTEGVAAVGGQGGGGGNGGFVEVDLFQDSDLSTQGDHAFGVVAQSVGGGGGHGGSVIDLSLGLPAVGIGGAGGDGGDGGNVELTTEAPDSGNYSVELHTYGENAHAIIAHSVGGGGGTGGDATGADIGLGDFQMAGGKAGGGDGGNVTAQLDGAKIWTSGGHASGVIAQSVGGGGGIGGMASGLDADLGLALSAQVGGSGGPGGDGGRVDLTLDTSLIVTGLPADATDWKVWTVNEAVSDGHGIFAQSVGGGGGVGGGSAGRSIAIAVPTDSVPVGMEADFSAGGTGGDGGRGGDVTVTLDKVGVETHGLSANAVMAQSISGGGGSGGTGSAAGSVIGLGKDTITANMNMALGGLGGNAQPAGTVSVALRQGTALTTAGDFSNGVVAQSIGGGGGNAASGTASSRNWDAGPGVSMNFGIGGFGGQGGDGGTVSFGMDGNANIATYGEGARAVLVQSIGGGGGTSQGVTAGLSVSALKSTATLKMGLQGGAGGKGGDLTLLDVTGRFFTFGADADGFLAQSIGGGGGLGGSVGGAGADNTGIIQEIKDLKSDLNSPFDLRASLGGRGGSGQDGGDITGLNLSGQVTTHGDFAEGVVVQSIAGGGGAGGAGNVQTSVSKLRLLMSMGGYGGVGGEGGDIDYNFSGGQLWTQGFAAHGLVLQSLGGGGGVGGSGARLACGKINLGGGFLAPEIPGEDQTPEQMCDDVPSFLSVDGQNGVSGHGGDIVSASPGDETRRLTVATMGRHAHGIIVQSLGGGGGIGGIGSSAVTEDADDVDVQHDVDVSLGGSSAAAGHGLGATLEGSLTITTSGAGAAGALVQSVGGGGGVASVDGITGLTMGGTGFVDNDDDTADGGDATVKLYSGSSFATTAQGAHGLAVQSIGAGGGFVTGALAQTGGDGGALGVYVGATGGSRAVGGDVSAQLLGDADAYARIVTQGRFARGIVAQSVGGGGGQYTSVSDDIGGPVKAVVTRLGARNGGGHGGSVEVNLSGAIQTAGHGADGVLAQSIGSGGGGIDLAPRGDQSRGLDIVVGAQNGTEGDGSPVTLIGGQGGIDAPNATVVTTGDYAYGLLLQSIGGGGGLVDDATSGASGSVSLGATGGAGGVGNTVSLAPIPNSTDADFNLISTAGADAHAIVAQSIGAGGGVARVRGAQGGVDASLGGGNVTNANAGSVDVSLGYARIVTGGDRSIGIVAQSIGGGGGILSVGAGQGLGSTNIGGAKGNGGSVNVFTGLNVSVETSGAGAHGIVAQSIGGGGGIIGDFGAGGLEFATYDGTAAIANNGGNGRAVSLTLEGPVTTTGDHAYGVIAQSVGSGGGLIGDGSRSVAGSFADARTAVLSDSGAITLMQFDGATIRATGMDSMGIFAHSIGSQDANGIYLTLEGTVQGGDGEGVGIFMAGGAYGIGAIDDNLINLKAGAHVSAVSGVAIEYQSVFGGAQGVGIENSGVIEGDVLGYALDGSPYTPAFSGSLPTGTLSAISAAAPRNRRAVVQLVNMPKGTLVGARRYLADVENRGTLIPGDDGSAERVRIAGDFVQTDSGRIVAALDFEKGEGDLLHVNGSALLDGTLEIDPITLAPSRAITLIQADRGMSGNFDTVLGTLFELGTEVRNGALSIQVTGANFDQPGFGLNAQQGRVAGYLEDLFMADTGTHAAFFGALEQLAGQGSGAYASGLTGLAPGATLAAPAANFALAHDRLDDLMGCGEALDPAAQGTCLRWLGGVTRLDQQTGDDGTFGYEGNVWRIGVAGQAPVADGWFAGGALGYEGSSLESQTGLSSTRGDTAFAGLSLTHAMGPFTLTGALSGSWGQHDLRRNPDGLLTTGRADAETDVWSVAARLRGAWTMSFHQGWLTPALDLDVIHSGAGGYTENGPALTALRVSGGSETALVATPSLEVGTWTPLTDALTLKAWARVGASLSTLDSYSTSARFAAAGAAGGGFDNAVGVADVVGRISAGVTLVGSDRFDVDLGYAGGFADGYASHGGSLRATIRF
ncbi:autotransporter outer membrane beta-barrel domain-containing protein [Albimonas sp. CAU 1670]|uniref:autotransporter outer membrane beta-barrel domain-containing protein n=1 Tax=Albimonas sp. CAU 1670 TaxID=3032599 RepID=UPI0023DC8BAA|nr:autotransporter outer membrane beta-barrel domain-containing protein [Albimonas sp. CAU 1670]MDF2231310.1 autotransporter outer membrane beta-barrel domain-containing protein [Albimonas sp. CAU 1670]